MAFLVRYVQDLTSTRLVGSSINEMKCLHFSKPCSYAAHGPKKHQWSGGQKDCLQTNDMALHVGRRTHLQRIYHQICHTGNYSLTTVSITIFCTGAISHSRSSHVTVSKLLAQSMLYTKKGPVGLIVGAGEHSNRSAAPTPQPCPLTLLCAKHSC